MLLVSVGIGILTLEGCDEGCEFFFEGGPGGAYELEEVGGDEEYICERNESGGGFGRGRVR